MNAKEFIDSLESIEEHIANMEYEIITMKAEARLGRDLNKYLSITRDILGSLAAENKHLQEALK